MDSVVVVICATLDVARECILQSRGYWVGCMDEFPFFVRRKWDLDLIQIGRKKLDLC